MKPENTQTLTLHLKIGLLMAAVLIVFGLVVGTVGIDYLSRALREEAVSRGQAIASSLASSLVEIITAQQEAAVSAAIRTVKRTAGLAYVEVVNPDGTLIAHTFEGAPPDRDIRARQEAVKIQNVTVAGKEAIDVPAEIITGAIIHVGLDQSAIAAKVHAARLAIIRWTGVGLILALLATFWVAGPFARTLRRTEEKYRSIFENATEGIFQTIPDGRYLSVNAALARIYGYASPEELMTAVADIGRQLYVNPHRRAEFIGLMEEHGAVSGFESDIYRNDGSVIWISENARAVRDAGGRLLYYEGTVVDVTERKRAEEALRESEEKYRGLFENANDWIVTMTLDGTFTSVNRAAEGAAGWSREELLGHAYRKLATPASVLQWEERTRRVLAGEKLPQAFETEIVAKDGRVIPLEGRTRFIRDKDGKPVGIQGVFRDIAERKRAEAALKESEERYRELFREAEEGRQVLGRLSHVALSMQVSWEQEDRLQAFIQGAQEAIGFDRGHVWLLTPDGSGLEPVKSYGEEETIPLSPLPLSPAAGPFFQAFQTRRPVVVLQDEDLEKILPVAPSLQTHSYFRTKRFVLVPLVVGERVIGVVSVDNKRTRRPINPASIEPLTLLCQQLATALDEASLYAEAQAREREATRLYEVTRELASSLDVERILNLIAEKTLELLGCDASGIYLYNEAKGGLTFVGGLNLDSQLTREIVVRPGEGVAGRAFQERRPAWTGDRLADPSLGYSPATEKLIRATALRAYLAVPIMSGGEVYGALMGAFHLPHDFTPREVQLLSTLADQTAIALENARLFAESEKRRRAAEALAEVGRLISQTLDSDVVAQRIAESLRTLLNARSSAVFRLDPETGDLHVVAASGQANFDRGMVLPRGTGTVGLAVRERQLVVTSNLLHDPRVTLSADQLASVERGGNYAALHVPLLAQDRVIGDIGVGDSEGRIFHDDEVQLAQAFADQAVLALENARLFREAQAREREATRLYEVTRELASSLDVERILNLIAEKMLELLGCDASGIYLYDEAKGGLTFVRGLNLDSQLMREIVVRPGEGVAGRAFQERRPAWTGDRLADPSLGYSPATEKLIRATALRAYLAVPIMSGGEVYGALMDAFHLPHDFTPREVQLLSTLADQAAIALQNARLFGETQTQRTRLTQIFDSTSDGMVLVNRGGQIEAANQRAGELFAANPEAVVGFPLTDLLSVHFPSGVEYDRAVSALRAVLADPDGGGEGTLELPSPRRILHWVAQPTKHTAGATAGLTLTFQDVTELEAARVKAEAANRAKSEFLAMMSHEIRTPMNGVIGMTGLLLDTALTAEQRQYAEAVRHSGEELLTVINDILDFSKIEAGRLELEQIEFDLLTTMEDVAELLAERASAKGLELVCSIQPDVPTALRGDPGRLRQILINLAGNAIKFTEHGEVVIRVSPAEESANAVLLRVEVTDTGIGIAAEGQARLFQSFSQVDASTTRRHGGTGLGLAISKRLAELMDGQIGVESELGQGSTFWFTARFETLPAQAEHPPVDLYGHRVLIVDDNATNRLVLEKYCAAWGMPVGSAADGARALQMLRAAAVRGEPYDLAILDLQMPGMDGVELAQAISADPPLAAVRLVMLASLRERGQMEAARQAGILAYLTKPVRRAQLFDCLRAALGAMAEPEAPAPRISQPTLPDALARPLARVLVVEDNAVNQQVALRMLEKRGYRANVVANGLEAVEALARIPYDLVLMDCQMPEMDGFEATAAIRAREGSRGHTPIIAMTANAMKGDRERCLAAGMDDYISKPVLAEELETVLRRWLRELQAEGSAPEGAPGDDGTEFDRNEALTRADGDEAFLRSLIGLFWEGCPGLVAEIRTAVGRCESPALARAAHSLKGSASQIGARQVARLAAELEQQGRAGSMDDAEPFVAQLEVDVDRLRARLCAEGLSE